MHFSIKNILPALFLLVVAGVTAQSLPNGVYFIRVVSTGKYLGVAGIDPNNGAALIQWDFFNQDNHKFEVKSTPDGHYTMKAIHSGRFLNVEGQSVDENARIIQWDYVDQANLQFFLVQNMNGEGYFVQGKQSRKYWTVDGNSGNNGAAIIQTKAAGQAFVFESVNGGFKVKKDQVSKTNIHGAEPIKKTRSTSDGRTINSTYQLSPPIGGATKMSPQYGQSKAKFIRDAVADDPHCDASVIAVSLENNSFMTADIASQVEEIVPGSVFHITDYLNGSWKRQESGRNPIVISSSVKNVIAGGTVYETINNPSLPNLRQGIANLYGQFTENADKQTNLDFKATIKEVNNEADFQLKIGAGAHYLGFSINNLFSFKQGEKRNYLLIDLTKVMFTIDVDPPANGFFSNPETNQDPNMVYLKKADYGLRVLASVETTESLESIANKLNVKVEALVAGFDVSMDLLSSKLDKTSTVKMFIVGGNSREVVPAYDIADLKAKVSNLARTLTYQTSQPIKYVIATTRDNYIVNYYSSTDEFIKQTCTPPAVLSAGAKLEINNVMLSGTQGGDLDCYGKIWGMAYRADNQEIPALRGNNMLMDVRGANNIDLSQYGAQYRPATSINYVFPAGSTQGAYVDLYFALFDQDANEDYATGDDDQFVFQNMDASKYCENDRSSRRLCYKKIYLDDIMPGKAQVIREDMIVDGDLITVMLNVSKTLDQTK